MKEMTKAEFDRLNDLCNFSDNFIHSDIQIDIPDDDCRIRDALYEFRRLVKYWEEMMNEEYVIHVNFERQL